MPSTTNHTFVFKKYKSNDLFDKIYYENPNYKLTIRYDGDFESDQKANALDGDKAMLHIVPKGRQLDITYNMMTREGFVFDSTLQQFIAVDQIADITDKLSIAENSLRTLHTLINELFPTSTGE